MNEKKINKLIKRGGLTSTKNKQSFQITIITHIVNHNIINPVVYSILLLIQLFQMLYITVRAYKSIDRDFEYFIYVVEVFSYFHIALKASSSFWVLFITCFHYFLIFVILASTLLLLIIEKGKKKRLISFISTTLNTALTLGITIFLIPAIGSFIYPVLCRNGDNLFFSLSYMPCGGTMQIVFSVVGIAFALFIIVSTYLIARMITDDYWLSILAWAGEGTEPHMFNEMFKILVALYFAIDVKGTYNYIAIIVFFFIDLIIVYKRITCSLPYSYLVFVIKAFIESVLLIFYIYGILEMILDIKINLIITFFTFAIAVCLTIAISMISSARRSAVLRKNWRQLKSMEEAEVYVSEACKLHLMERDTPEWKLVLPYLIHLHVCDCSDINCYCKQTKINNFVLISSENSQLKQFFLKVYEEILLFQVKKWGNSRNLVVTLSYFSSIMMKNYFKAYYWLIQTDSLDLHFTERYLLTRNKKILSDLIIQEEAKIDGINIENIKHFQKLCIRFQRLLVCSTTVVISFWSLLEMAKINLQELYRIGKRITVFLKHVNDLFKACVELNSEYPYNYYYYGRFTYYVLNNENYGTSWIDKGYDIMRQQKENHTKHKENIIKNYDAAVIIILGQAPNLGIVKSANEHVQKQLGFAPLDLIGRNISRVMPKAIGEAHDTFLTNNVKQGAGELLKHEMLVFVQTKEGLITPVFIQVKTLPGLEFDLKYIGFIRRDLAKLKTKYIKLPSQYKTYNLGYLLADEYGFMAGISKNACSLFGLNTGYIKRKKGITTIPYPLSKLSEKFSKRELDKTLKNGIEMTLHIGTILDYLDYDYLQEREREYITEYAKVDHKAFVMLIDLEYHSIVKLRVYLIVNLGKVNSISGVQLQVQRRNSLLDNSSDHDIKEAVKAEDALTTIQSITSASSERSSEKGTVINIKNKATSSEKNAIIIRLLVLIFGFSFIIIIIDFTCMGLYISSARHINRVESILILTYIQMTHYKTFLYKMLEYLNLANGIIEDLDQIDPMIFTQMRQTGLSYLHDFKNDVYKMDNSMSEYISKELAQTLLYKQIDLSKIFSNSTYYKQTVKLSYGYVKIIGMALHIFNRDVSMLQSVNYVNNFVNSTATLNKLEQIMVFILGNSLTVIYRELLSTTNSVHNFLYDEVNEKMDIIFIIHCVNFGIIGLFILSLVPTVVRIHKSKKNLLLLFGDIPLHVIKKLNNNCKEFLRSDLSHISDTGSGKSIEGGKNIEDNEEVALNFKDKSEADDNIPLLTKNKEQAAIEEGKPTEEEVDESAKRQLEKAQSDQEKAFMEERKRSIKGVIINLLGIIISLTIIFGLVFGYHIKMLVTFQLNRKNNIDNTYALIILHKRFLYITNCLLFYKVYLKSIEGFNEPINTHEELAQNYMLATRNENQVQSYINFPSGSLKKLAELLKTYDGSDLCEIGISNGAKVNLEWCKTVHNGILNEGFSNSISYFIIFIRNSYFHIRESTNSKQLKLETLRSNNLKDISNIFFMFYSPIFDYLDTTGFNIYIDQTNKEITLLVIDYMLAFIFIMIGLLVLTQYFVKRMEEEMFMARGILALLPEDMIKHNAMLEALIESHRLS